MVNVWSTLSLYIVVSMEANVFHTTEIKGLFIFNHFKGYSINASSPGVESSRLLWKSKLRKNIHINLPGEFPEDQG